MLRRPPPYDREPTLCVPDGQKSCFACCPPIRPAGYEHIQHRTIIQRMLRENTREFDNQARNPHPITGFSCWALGYLDDACRLVGCLLHPARHHGRDLRSLVDYEGKCRRESCPESRVFLELPLEARRFWLHLTEGLDSFQYSSRRFNPLFRLLGWGPILLGHIASNGQGKYFTRDDLSEAYPVLATTLDPRANAYLLGSIARLKGLHSLQSTLFAQQFEQFSADLLLLLRVVPHESSAPFTHLLPLDPLFLDLLRLGGGIQRIHEHKAITLKAQVDTALSHFISKLQA